MRTAWGVFKRQCYYELLYRSRQPRVLIQSVLFFVMMMIFFPMSWPASSAFLKEVGVGLTWMATLFVALLASEGLFQREFEQGELEQAFVSGEPMSVMMLATLIIHTFMHLLPIVALIPVLSVFFGMTGAEIKLWTGSLLVGAPSLFALTALAAAFNVGKIQRTTLMALVVLPLTVPVLIFGSSVMYLAKIQDSAGPLLALLTAISLLCLGILPFAMTGVLKLRFED